MLFEFFTILLWKVNSNPDIALKLCDVAWSHEKLKTFYLHYHSAQSNEAMQQIEYILSSLALDQRPANMERWWLTLRGFHP